ncbi:cell division site-positioning protein MapZ family protein [Streptococcus sp. ZJ93]|uniref:cell division site-positioning protein MapZ family protein n=1 Tax=Streptococcus handemini TaxID=3161188 RepID=UPI0032EC2D5F
MVKETEHQDNLPENDEKVLDFEDAKHMTVEEAVRKHEELQVGVTDEDGVLDRYIKQHRDAIESEKYETKINIPVVTEEVAAMGNLAEEATDEGVTVEFPSGYEEVPLADEAVASVVVEPFPAPESAEFNDFEEDSQVGVSTKKKALILSSLAALFVAVLATAFVWLNHSEQNKTAETEASSSSTTSTSSQDANTKAFNTLYASFFTDTSQSKLKNNQFDKLPNLKALLDKMDSKSADYKKAKEKYDHLEKAIQAVQATNQQFDKPIIVDGELDTTATAKADANFASTTTGIAGVDATVTAAINFGRSQQETPASSVVAPSAPVNPAPAPETAVTEVAPAAPISGNAGQVVVGINPLYGIAVPAGVTLQRNLSRVPYDQAKIDDVNNPAWAFNPGVLEQIITVSQERGYISGYQYILEPVNIINGNGYYNLFRPDGTYLFSINAKTGYFVGNGAGYADDLDY